MSLDFDLIAQNALAQGFPLLQSWFPGIKKEGHEAVMGDISGKPGQSFKINLKTGKWADFAAGINGGDFISLYAAKEGIKSNLEAGRKLSELLGVHAERESQTPATKEKKAEPPLEIVPEGAPKPPQSMRKKVGDRWVEYPAAKHWKYDDRYGATLGYVMRVEVDGKKEIIPLRWFDGRWQFKAFPEPRPLYNLGELYRRPADPVVIGEGEKTADALKFYFGGRYVAVTWPGGSKAWRKADWRHLKDRQKVVIIPDADKPGIEAANGIAEKLRELGVKEVKVVDVDGMPEGWDAADALKEGWSHAQMKDWIKPRAVVAGVKLENATKQLAATSGGIVEDTTKPQPIEEEKPGDHFRMLGYAADKYYFYIFKTGQIIGYTGTALEKKGNLYTLAPKDYWDGLFQGKFDLAMNAIIRQSERVGFYDPSRIRGCGAWDDDGKCVLHLGDRLIVDGKSTRISDFKTKFIYEQRRSMQIETTDPASDESATMLLKICRHLRWAEPMFGNLFAGWLFCAPICGALPWRSHLYLIGPAGSGKSWVLENIAGRYLRGIALPVQSKSTEAGIRQAIGSDARPIIFDEAEAENEQDRKRIQSVLDLARAASSNTTAATAKGGQGGVGLNYMIRSAFLFASISPSLSQYADETRATILRLMPPATKGDAQYEADKQRFREVQDMVFNTMSDDYRASMIARAIKLMPVIIANFRVFSDVGQKFFGSPRAADQMAMMLAGLYALRHKSAITHAQAEVWIREQDWSEVSDEPLESTEVRLMNALMETEIRYEKPGVGQRVNTVGEMIKSVQENGEFDHQNILRRYGIIIDRTAKVVWFSNTSNGLKKILRDTPWGTKWAKVMMNIPGNQVSGKTMSFGDGHKSWGTGVPYDYVMGNVR